MSIRYRLTRSKSATTAVLPPVPSLVDPSPDPDSPVAATVHAVPDALTSNAKRVFDLFGAVTLLLVFSPVWLLAVVVIRLTSPGPAIFRQERVGVGGRPFTMYKFRTMHNGVPDQTHRDYVTRLIRGGRGGSKKGAVYKLTRDARVTTVGRLLRKTSLDEVPQLINVIRGDMSLVGPRPPLRYEVDQYEPWQLERLTVRPGITGLWQVSGRNRLAHDEMCLLDVRYVRGWSLGLDLSIVVRTPWVMLVDGGGAS